MIYHNTDIKDLYSKLYNPKSSWLYEYEKEGGKGKCLDAKYFQSDTAAWEDGYKILDYYNILTLEMIPTFESVFWEVEKTLTEIANSGSISYDNKTIAAFPSYKAVIDHLANNYTVTRTGGSSGTTHLTFKLKDSCLSTMSYGDDGIISGYNSRQSTNNNNAFSKAVSAKNSKSEPERFIIKEDEVKLKNISYTFSSTPVTLPATSAPTQPFNKSNWYQEYYGKKNS